MEQDLPRTDRRALLVLLALSGCGFVPAFGSGGAAQGLMGAVRAADPKDQRDHAFVGRIEDRFGRPGVALFELGYGIMTRSEAVAITGEGAITRFNLVGTVDWTLDRRSDGLRLAGGSEGSFTSYSATGSTVAGLTAKMDAERRLMVILADQVVARVIATSGGFGG